MPNSNDTIEFDPNLSIPFGLKDAEYVERNEVTPTDIESASEDDDDAVDEFTENDEEFIGTDDDTDDEALEAPGFMQIVSQVIRTAPDGRQVVDVVLEVEDIEGTEKYDVRVTK